MIENTPLLNILAFGYPRENSNQITRYSNNYLTAYMIFFFLLWYSNYLRTSFSPRKYRLHFNAYVLD